MNPNYPLVAERAGHRCEYCHAPEAIFNVPFEVDHIMPLAKGGLPLRLEGKTSTGRVTIERLQMNTPLQLVARAQWVELGLFP